MHFFLFLRYKVKKHKTYVGGITFVSHWGRPRRDLHSLHSWHNNRNNIWISEEEIARQDPGLRRHPRESLRAFLLSSLAAPLDGKGQKLVHQFCDTYEFARHHPGDFGEDEYQTYSRLLLKLLDA